MLKDVECKPYSSKLLAADGRLIDSVSSAVLNITIGSKTIDHEFIIVPDLSSDLIIGIDIIQDLELKARSRSVVLNGELIPLYIPDNTQIGRLMSSITLKQSQNQFVEIRNPFHGKSNIKNVFVESLPKISKNRFILNSSIHENSEFLQVCLTTNKKIRGSIRKNQKICSITPIEINDSINGIKFVDSDQEKNLAENFQNERLKRYGIINDIKVAQAGDQLTNSQFNELNSLFNANHLAFARSSNDIGKLSFFRYTLPMLNEEDTAYQPPRPVPLALKDKVIKEIEKFVSLGIIEPSQSGFNIPLIIVKKSDGTIRTSLDARQLNTKLIQDRWPLPTISELLYKVGSKLTRGNDCYITSLDISKAYWTVQVDEKDKHKVSFSYNNKHWCAKRMLYGLSSAPAAWSRIVSTIFDHPDVLLYLDDFLVISNSFDEHKKALEFIFKACIQHGLTLSTNKP